MGGKVHRVPKGDAVALVPSTVPSHYAEQEAPTIPWLTYARSQLQKLRDNLHDPFASRHKPHDKNSIIATPSAERHNGMAASMVAKLARGRGLVSIDADDFVGLVRVIFCRCEEFSIDGVYAVIPAVSCRWSVQKVAGVDTGDDTAGPVVRQNNLVLPSVPSSVSGFEPRPGD